MGFSDLMEIHQILPNFCYGDAVSNHALELKKLLRKWGYRSEINELHNQSEVDNHCKSFKDYQPNDQTLTFYHYSIGCKELTSVFPSFRGIKSLIYHNITPGKYFNE